MPHFNNVNKLANTNKPIYTAVPKTSINPRKIVGAIMVPADYVFTSTEINNEGSFTAALQALLIADNFLLRGLFLGPFVAVTSNGEAKAEQTFDYGTKVPTKAATYGFRFQYIIGGIGNHINWMALKGKQDQYSVLWVDEDNLIIGTMKVDANGKMGIGGIALSQLDVENFEVATGSTVAGYFIQFNPTNARDMNENFGSISLSNFDVVNDSNRVNGIQLEDANTTAAATGIFRITPYIDGGGGNLAEIYVTESIIIGNWQVINTATKGVITITSINIIGNTIINLVADITDTDWPASGGKVTISNKAISVLAANGMEYFESNSITYTV